MVAIWYGLQNARHSRAGGQYSIGVAVNVFQSFRAALRLAHRHRGSQSLRRLCTTPPR
jgi:hypothetical protein